jgi:ketosteroid isomerase-like protein
MRTVVNARRPEDCDRILLDACERGDLDTAVALYEPGAVMYLLSTGELARTPEAIRTEFASLIELKPKFTIEEIVSTVHGDGSLATTRLRGFMDATAPNGEAMHVTFHTLEVVRKQADGTWRFAIDDPRGSSRG